MKYMSLETNNITKDYHFFLNKIKYKPHKILTPCESKRN